jgi:hypothetical protein
MLIDNAEALTKLNPDREAAKRRFEEMMQNEQYIAENFPAAPYMH